jgi:hypothetical protein
MNKHQIYVHGENARDPQLVEISENANVNDIIDLYRQQFNQTTDSDQIELYLEDEDEPKSKKDQADKANIKKRSHVHCHRCKKIKVTVFYNGDDKSFEFPPSATTKKIMKKVVKEFGISESDSGDYLLKLDDKTILQPSDHIGSFSSYPLCQVKLFLTPTKPVQG